MGAAHWEAPHLLRCRRLAEGGGHQVSWLEGTQSAVYSWEGVQAMKTVDLTSEAPTVDQLLKLAIRDNVILRTAEGREFLLAELEDLDEEIELIRRDQELMQFLDQRSHDTKRYTLAQ